MLGKSSRRLCVKCWLWSTVQGMLALAVTKSSVNTGNRIRGDDQLCTAKAYLLACEVLLENCLYIAYASIRLRLAYPNSTGTFENIL